MGHSRRDRILGWLRELDHDPPSYASPHCIDSRASTTLMGYGVGHCEDKQDEKESAVERSSKSVKPLTTNNAVLQIASCMPCGIHKHTGVVGPPFGKRQRRKTRPDLYEPKNTSTERLLGLEEHSAKKRRLGRSSRRKNDPITRVLEKFAAENVKTGRLTLSSRHHLGLFQHGKSSPPVRASHEHTFSEMSFLENKNRRIATQNSPILDADIPLPTSARRIQQREGDNEDEHQLRSGFGLSFRHPTHTQACGSIEPQTVKEAKTGVLLSSKHETLKARKRMDARSDIQLSEICECRIPEKDCIRSHCHGCKKLPDRDSHQRTQRPLLHPIDTKSWCTEASNATQKERHYSLEDLKELFDACQNASQYRVIKGTYKEGVSALDVRKVSHQDKGSKVEFQLPRLTEEDVLLRPVLNEHGAESEEDEDHLLQLALTDLAAAPRQFTGKSGNVCPSSPLMPYGTDHCCGKLPGNGEARSEFLEDNLDEGQRLSEYAAIDESCPVPIVDDTIADFGSPHWKNGDERRSSLGAQWHEFCVGHSCTTRALTSWPTFPLEQGVFGLRSDALSAAWREQAYADQDLVTWKYNSSQSHNLRGANSAFSGFSTPNRLY